MDMRKFTEKSANALQDAQRIAKEYGNQEIGQTHLLYALITADEGLIPQLLTKMGTDLKKVFIFILYNISILLFTCFFLFQLFLIGILEKFLIK